MSPAPSRPTAGVRQIVGVGQLTGAPRTTGDRVVVASHNPGKLAELSALLRARGITPVPAADLGLAPPPETGETLEANARDKALRAARATGLPALADDGGLFLAALDGWPGVHTAREVAALGGWERALPALVHRLGDDRRARHGCALALAWPDGTVLSAVGYLVGCLVWPPRGHGGAPIDGAFLPDGSPETLGELTPQARAGRTPRALALAPLAAALSPEPLSAR